MVILSNKNVYDTIKFMNNKNQHEQIAWKKNLYVCGIDEAGRGCLSGPVVVAAAILPISTTNTHLQDSKTMTKSERERMYEWIIKNCFFSTVFVDVATIETKNIYQATKLAMKKAFVQLVEIIPFPYTKIAHLITDAMPLAPPQICSHSMLTISSPARAESLSATVAAASIVAKVTRDRLMSKLAVLFPNFSLAQHKGYGTAQHKQELLSSGQSVIHRPSFVHTALHKEKKSRNHEQQTIC